MTKLVIQIPCFNEEKHIGQTIADLPRTIEGIDEIEVLIIDDGSIDETVSVAMESGAHHIKALTQNLGLANAYSVGIDTCNLLGADIVVNTDADNQYDARDIAKLVAPILSGEADIVIGDRETDSIGHFSLVKKYLQKFGSQVVRRASGTSVADSTSGFRAMNKKAMNASFIHNRFTYTLESIIHAGSKGLKIGNVKVRTNSKARPSRLFSSTPDYLKKNGPVILRSYVMYWPIQTFGFIAAMFMIGGSGLIGRFLYYYFQAPEHSAHIQSLQVGIGMVVIAFVVFLLAILSDLIAANRRISEELLTKVRFIEARLQENKSVEVSGLGLIHTASKSWKDESLKPNNGS